MTAKPNCLVSTIDALSAAIVGFPAPAQLSTTNATSAFVVAIKDSPSQLRICEKIPSYFRRGRSPQGLRGW